MLANRFNFRAFVKPYNKIYKVYSLENDGTFTIQCFKEDGETLLKRNDNETNLFLFKQDEFVLMQSTGLTDKNGKKIFEGDIIKINKISKAIIEFKNSGFFIVEKGYNDQLLNNFVNYKVIEVIGNIYENKELLKN